MPKSTGKKRQSDGSTLMTERLVVRLMLSPAVDIEICREQCVIMHSWCEVMRLEIRPCIGKRMIIGDLGDWVQ